jgi:DNA-binding MarR family transcriptional regulator
MVRTGAEQDHIDVLLEEIAEQLPDIDFVVEGITTRIGGLSKRFQRSMDETLAEVDLNWGEFKLLSSLHRSTDRRRSPGKLAAEVELSSGAMTNRLDRLESAGFVRRRPDPDDRRGVQVELTAAGAQAFERAVDLQAAKEAHVASALSDREKEQLNVLLRKLMLEFERRDPKKR